MGADLDGNFLLRHCDGSVRYWDHRAQRDLTMPEACMTSAPNLPKHAKSKSRVVRLWRPKAEMTDCSMTFFRSDTDPRSYFSVVVEDDGRVCYGYLRSPDGKIVGDVWLYNRCAAPLEPEWEDRAKASFANPLNFVQNPLSFALPNEGADIAVAWSMNEHGDNFADILLRGHTIGRLQAGKKPGWALAAARDGTLAKVLQAP